MNKEITIYTKKRTTADKSRTFYTYLTTMTNKDGVDVTMSVSFPTGVTPPKPESCPCNIIVEKSNCNISTREYVVEDTGEIKESKTLWVKAYINGSQYVDHSTDDFM